MVDSLPRPRLERLLDQSLTHRVTLLLGDVGFGKTALLRSWAPGVNAIHYTATSADADPERLLRAIASSLRLRVPDLPAVLGTAMYSARGPSMGVSSEQGRLRALAGELCAALAERLTRDLVLIIDDVDTVTDEAGVRAVISGLVHEAPPLFHLVLSAQRDPPVELDRLRAANQVLEIGGRDLLFTRRETSALLASTGQAVDPTTQERIHDATGGWPAALSLAAARLGATSTDHDDLVARLGAATRRGFEDLVEDLHRGLTPRARSLLETVCRFEHVAVPLLEQLGHADAAEDLATLERSGLVIDPEPAETGWYLVREAARDAVHVFAPADPGVIDDLHRRAGEWLLMHGMVGRALGEIAAAVDTDALADLLVEHGERLVESGHARDVLEAVETLPADDRGPRIALIAGAAAMVRGDWDTALDHLDVARGPDVGLAAAWRSGVIHYLRGDLDRALAIYEGADPSTGREQDRALLHAWHATAMWIRGDRGACRRLATRALEHATAAGDLRALAAAHTVMAMLAALDGDRRANDVHYLRALEYAEEARDGLQMARIRTNRASHHLEEGRYREALAELEVAINLADVTGHGTIAGMALRNRAEARMHLGMFEQAHADLVESIRQFEAVGSRMVAYPLALLGRLHRLRGDHAAAREALSTAIELSEPSGDVQGLVPALADLARLLVWDDLAAAAAAAQRALEVAGDGMGQVDALLAAATVDVVAGDVEVARERAERAAELARERRDPAGEASALEILARTGDDTTAVSLASRAVTLRQQVGDRGALERTRLLQARYLPMPASREVADEAVHALREQGLAVPDAHLDAATSSWPSSTSSSSSTSSWSSSTSSSRPVAIDTLGAFRVRIGDVAVPAAAWRSNKAQQLLKLLVLRRGQPLPRDAAMAVLWPDEGSARERLANRFNVALSTVRSMLDPDRVWDSGHHVSSVGGTIRLDLEHVDVDLERFMRAADDGLAAYRDRRPEVARALLEVAASTYRGDLLPEDAYADWAVAPREQARMACIEVLHALAEMAAATDDHGRAARYLLRALERDGFDERAHLGLVRAEVGARRHGDARRHYRLYAERMRELGLEPMSYAAVADAAVGDGPEWH